MGGHCFRGVCSPFGLQQHSLRTDGAKPSLRQTPIIAIPSDDVQLGVICGKKRKDYLKLTGHQVLIFLVLVSAPPAPMATFTASSIGSLKGTSIRSRPCS